MILEDGALRPSRRSEPSGQRVGEPPLGQVSIQATYPPGLINTAVGAVTTPSAGSSYVPMHLASISSTRSAHGVMSKPAGSPRLRSTGRASCSRVKTRGSPLAVTRSRSGMRPEQRVSLAEVAMNAQTGHLRRPIVCEARPC